MPAVSAEEKARVALEAVTGQRATNEIASPYDASCLGWPIP